MWPFLRQKIHHHVAEKSGSPVRRSQSLNQFLEEMGDWSDLAVHDVAFKFWLPEPAEAALDSLRRHHADSLSEALRQFFLVHCYGHYVFSRMCEEKPGFFKEVQTLGSNVLYSRSVSKSREETYWVPELGKNVVPIKVWIPSRLRTDLQTLADHVGIPASQYAREIVISRLFGHGTLPMRPEMLQPPETVHLDAWCSNQPVPMRQVGMEEFWHYKTLILDEVRIESQTAVNSPTNC
jgi:hypothetical protein